MTTAAAYNFAPTLSVMLIGALLAATALLWVRWRNHQATGLRRYRAVLGLTLFLTFDLILFGAFTRLTDSGLGCPDWPGCYGHASPVGAARHIEAAQELMPTGPVTHGKAWVEMLHRYLATGVGALILLLTVWAWRQRLALRQHNWPHPWWPTLTLVWVCLQGAFGAWTVTLKLSPVVVTLHLLGGMVLLALLGAQVARTSQTALQGRVGVSRFLYIWLILSLGLLGLQIALGGWVSSNYAVLACSDFPKCQGSWWPPMDFAQGFELWRGLGLTAQGEAIDFAALTAIHIAHRYMALVVLLFLGGLAWRANRVRALRGLARALAALTIFQLLTGLSNVVLSWPLLAAVLHTGGAAALVLVLTWMATLSRAMPVPPAVAGFARQPSP